VRNWRRSSATAICCCASWKSWDFTSGFATRSYREEFAVDDCIVAVDETPVGVFVEIEGGERGIAEVAQALGRKPDDYLLESYRGLFVQYCEQRGIPATDMLFEAD